MITTSFFSQSLCSSSAVIRRALSGGGGAGVAWFAGRGVCESSVSFELQANRPTPIRESKKYQDQVSHIWMFLSFDES